MTGPHAVGPVTVEILGQTYTWDPDTITIEDPAKEFEGMITAAEYAVRHGVSAATVRRWLADGRIEGDRHMGRWYVNADAEPPRQATGRPRGSRIVRTRKVEKGPFRQTC